MPAEPAQEPRAMQPDAGSLAPADQIVSVNDRGRRAATPAAPFIAIGGIALVILIGVVLSVNIIRAKLSGPKPAAASQAGSAGLSRSFAADAPPPLPGEAAGGPGAAVQPVCADGSPGNPLRGTGGTVVRNAAGNGVKVCPDGQVLGTSSPALAAQPIPVVHSDPPRGARTYQSPLDPAAMPETPMMLNGGEYGHALPLSAPGGTDGAQAAFQAPVAGRTGTAEGLLTQAPADALERQLTPSSTPMVQAARIADLNTLLPKGRTIDCGLSVRLVSSLAGMATCIVTQNVYSANGRVLLIERGSEAVGEYRSGAARGQRRLFILWNRIITPGGVVINLQSPGADALGGTGLEGKVDNHWFERIGSAFLLSAVQDGIQYAIAQEQAKSGGATFVLGNTAQTGNQMAQRVLNDAIGIVPTIYKNQGDRAVIYVARDLDFSGVYKLRARP